MIEVLIEKLSKKTGIAPEALKKMIEMEKMDGYDEDTEMEAGKGIREKLSKPAGVEVVEIEVIEKPVEGKEKLMVCPDTLRDVLSSADIDQSEIEMIIEKIKEYTNEKNYK